MKIRELEWNNHPILGNLLLDLINPATAQPFNTVVFAGENGTGKTTILETLSTFLNIGSNEFFGHIDYSAAGQTLRAIPYRDGSTIKDFFEIIDGSGNAVQIRSNRNNNPQLIQSNVLDIRHYGCVFLKARADYKTRQITTTTTKRLDVDKYDNDTEDDFTSLKQLLVDIENQDNADYANLNKVLGTTPRIWDDFYHTSKIYRFKHAFDSFFGELTYDKVADSDNEKKILFSKNGRSISIDDLSTGEKQVVFRGAYLLKNSRQLNGAAIMIDEPELSMHPKWQKRCLRFYKDLFTENEVQNVQLFIATHSEYVLEEALRNDTENLVFVLDNFSGLLRARRIDAPSVLPSITSAETNYLAFDVVSNDYHIELYGYLQQKHSLASVKLCDEYIRNHNLYIPANHSKPSSFRNTTYDSLSTYIRNAIDHPSTAHTFTEAELRTSMELLIELCR